MKRKKFWIAFSVVFACVFVLVMVLALGFRLKTVDVEFWQRADADSTRLESGILDKVKSDGEFDYGRNLLTLDLSESIAKIEKANPYVKVFSAKKHFPNIVRIHIIERTPLFRIRCEDDADTWLILDEDFKILDYVSADDLAESEFYKTTTEVGPDTLTIASGYEIGDFVTIGDSYDEYLIAISEGVYGKTMDSASASSVSISVDDDGTLIFTVYMRNDTAEDGKGCRIVAYGTEKLKEMIYAGVSVFETQIADGFIENVSTSSITIKLIDGEIKCAVGSA